MRSKLSQREWIYPAVMIIVGFGYYMSYFNYGISPHYENNNYYRRWQK